MQKKLFWFSFLSFFLAKANEFDSASFFLLFLLVLLIRSCGFIIIIIIVCIPFLMYLYESSVHSFMTPFFPVLAAAFSLVRPKIKTMNGNCT